MASLFVAYAAYGLAFHYHISTHDYYSLPLVPLVGLGLGLAADAAAVRIRAMEVPRAVEAAFGSMLVLLTAAVLVYDLDVARPEPVSDVLLADARRIGEIVSHSTKTVLVSEGEGRHLTYHGDFAGSIWPTAPDFELAATQQRRVPTAQEMFEERIRAGAEWFVVTDKGELFGQPRLKALLADRGRLVAETDRFLVYDLRR